MGGYSADAASTAWCHADLRHSVPTMSRSSSPGCCHLTPVVASICSTIDLFKRSASHVAGEVCA